MTKKFDLAALNAEFVNLLDKHYYDTDVDGASKAEFIAEHASEEDEIREFWAMAYNAWDELCGNHPDLINSGLGWYAGAEFVGYGNPYDLYIGTGEEESNL